MRRSLIATTLLFVSVFCFAQQNLPLIIGSSIPPADSQSLYQIQVGAFRFARNMANTTNRLRDGGFNPIFENFGDLTRVIVSRVPANEIISNLEKLARLGFDRVIIREDPRGFTISEKKEEPHDSTISEQKEDPHSFTLSEQKEEPDSFTISEKWNIPGDQGRFSSFEFTQENRFIAVEKTNNKAYFGEYNMPAQNIINMSGLGTLRINTRNNDDLNLSFSPVNEPSRAESFSAVKETPMARDQGTDLFTKAWRISKRSAGGTVGDGVRTEDTIGRIYLYSINGTYLVTKTDGSVAYVSHWRWIDDSREEFLFSHDNWQTSWRSKITTINENSLVFNEGAGHFVEFVPAYK